MDFKIFKDLKKLLNQAQLKDQDKNQRIHTSASESKLITRKQTMESNIFQVKIAQKSPIDVKLEHKSEINVNKQMKNFSFFEHEKILQNYSNHQSLQNLPKSKISIKNAAFSQTKQKAVTSLHLSQTPDLTRSDNHIKIRPPTCKPTSDIKKNLTIGFVGQAEQKDQNIVLKKFQKQKKQTNSQKLKNLIDSLRPKTQQQFSILSKYKNGYQGFINKNIEHIKKLQDKKQKLFFAKNEGEKFQNLLQVVHKMVQGETEQQQKLKSVKYIGIKSRHGKVFQEIDDYYRNQGCNEVRQQVNQMVDMVHCQLDKIGTKHDNFLTGMKDQHELEVKREVYKMIPTNTVAQAVPTKIKQFKFIK